MTAVTARQALADAISEGATALDNVAVRGTSLADAGLWRFDLVVDMAEGVISDVLQELNGLTRKQFLDYDPSYQTSGSQVLVETLEEIPELAAVDAKIPPKLALPN